jgi:hypothetical protein
MQRTRLTANELAGTELFIEQQEDCLSWMNIYEDKTLVLSIHSSELANIPQVKALIDAAEQAKTLFDEQLEILFYNIPDANADDDDSARKALYNALAPFKKSLGDKE